MINLIVNSVVVVGNNNNFNLTVWNIISYLTYIISVVVVIDI